jgi:ferritin-like metal-binding protein YciE
MIEAATSAELKQGFETHRRQTEGHVSRLETIFKELDQDADGDKCKGMEGIIKEGSDLIKEKPEPAVLDAGLIAAAQHVEHYEIAGYGSVKSWARRLGREYQARLLEETLEEEKKTDALLTKMAEQSVNQEAEVGVNRAEALGDRATESRDSRGRATTADTPARS